MPFATTKAASDGMVASTQSHLRGLIKAGTGSSIAQLVAAGSGGGFAGFASGFSKGGKAREAYKMLRNWVAAATTAIATRCSNQPWMAGHYATAGAEERRPGRLTSKGYDREKFPLSMVKGYGTDIEPDQEHNVLWVLDKPNHLQGKTEFVEILVMNLLLTGEFYFIGGVTNQDDDRSLELWAVPSSWLVPDHGKRLFGGYKLQTGMGGGDGVPIPAENVCRGYFPDPSDIKGCLSPLQACLSAARIDDFILHSQEQSFERGIHPNLIVSVGKTLDADGKQTQRRPVLAPRQRTQITRSIMHAWNQTVNQGMPAIIDGLIEDIKKLSNTPSEMDWMQSGQSVKARLMQGFKVNPIVLGEVTPANKAQAVVAEQQVCKGAVNPILGKISCAASEFFSPFYEDGETLAVWLEQCNPKDDEMEFKQMTQGRQTGDITQEEYRSYLGLPPIEDPEPKRSPLFNNPQVLAAIAALAAQVSAGAMTHDNAVATLMVSLQISREQADEMMPDDPPEPPPMLPGQVPGQPGAPGTPPGPPTGPQAGQEPKPGPKPPPDEEDEDEAKDFNPDQPRDPDGRFASGGGSGASEGGGSEASVAALKDWWTGGSDDINEAARAGETHPAFAGLDEAIESATPTESETVVYRGISAPEGSHVAENMIAGYSFTDDGYIAVTSDEHIATRFATEGSMDNNAYICRIAVKAGTKMADIPSGIGEKLLRRGTGRWFKVDKVAKRRGENTYDVDLRYIDNK